MSCIREVIHKVLVQESVKKLGKFVHKSAGGWVYFGEELIWIKENPLLS